MLTTDTTSAPTESQPTHPVEAEAGREAPPIHDEHDDDFEIIEGERMFTQEQLDSILEKRLARQERAHAKRAAALRREFDLEKDAAVTEAIRRTIRRLTNPTPQEG